MKTKAFILIANALVMQSCMTTEESFKRFSVDEIGNVRMDRATKLATSNKAAQEIDCRTAVGDFVFHETECIDTMIFVPLETTRQSIFYGIDKMAISAKSIFICDSDGRLLIFRRDGRYIKTIAKGNGPGEISKLWDITYDASAKEFIVYQQDRLQYYDENGNFLRDKRSPILFYDFAVNSTEMLLFQPTALNRLFGHDADKALIITDKELCAQNKGISLLPNRLDMTMSAPAHISQAKDGFRITQKMNDTIFHYSQGMLESEFVLRHNYPNARKAANVQELAKSGDFYFTGGHFAASDAIVLYFWSDAHGLCPVVYDKKSKKVAGGAKLAIDRKIMPSVCTSTKATAGGYFVSYFNPNKKLARFSSPKISDKDKDAACGLEEESNAVLVFYKIRVK